MCRVHDNRGLIVLWKGLEAPWRDLGLEVLDNVVPRLCVVGDSPPFIADRNARNNPYFSFLDFIVGDIRGCRQDLFTSEIFSVVFIGL